MTLIYVHRNRPGHVYATHEDRQQSEVEVFYPPEEFGILQVANDVYVGPDIEIAELAVAPVEVRAVPAIEEVPAT
ncbi:MAG: hypothetical protein ABJF67_17590 [Aurantimonas coralicida]